ncbi:hypothetical protein A1O1_04518 [Capronia coronata CBS 617.96]|uniref:EthD domain-containing protein n=1 Tax=Capronia coronata CBS 617.96 TaxID=1182541 RepID=W9YQ97_9EURO|nr:uncharacterized protein A1O1_04518 [Capronia coronata CBS 617.96]EXJ91406.1 hypothetical protein A1O1_04518 [Capronia coronata CBS 617.96]
MLVLTICAFRKAGMGEDEFHHYMSEIHAPLIRDLLVKHGITRYSMTHNTTHTRSLVPQIQDSQFANNNAYDMVTQIRFPEIDNFVSFRNDPFYVEKIMPDHDRFTDPDRVL